ncbi:lysylphosphatidylglycerol synthase transmembrane domain-containing protein [Halomonas sp.]|uniref:lysylphosphatidylglycerol synthase transmembrane domain-containing protein n=1 Tax=Halomonas sp. TaxID=1486246 RepID=UPI00298DF73F|nr:lysylphosphatidylglycerol synthase transmembrane domain-containing protein [Halomonas sp.]MDW7746769.1 lysylphosphatidylglycerol synthase transmembrane domain-containing protein [Halomonas sp.]
MRSTDAADPRRPLPRWRPLHGLLVVLALLAPLVIMAWLGGPGALAAVNRFPLDVLALMLLMAIVCWNLNAARLRLMLDGRTGRLGQRGALGIELASKFALCATPGGSGGPATLLFLLAQRGLPASRGAAVFLLDQGCDLLFFLCMLTGLVAYSLLGETQWPHQTVVQIALSALALVAVGVTLAMGYLPGLLRYTASPGARWLSGYRRRWLARRLLTCRRALQATLRLPIATLMAMLGLTTAHWLLRYSLLYLAVLGAGGDVDWIWTFLTQMLAMAASQFSFLPGGAGAAELGVGGLLLPLMEREQAAAAVLVWRLVSYHLYLVAGAPLFLLSAYRLVRRPSPERT